MHLATTILLRFTEAFQRANLFVLLLFLACYFFGTFPARNVKVSSTLSLDSYRLALLVRSEHCDLCKWRGGNERYHL